MKDPNDCTYPHTRLCLHNCSYGCAKRSPQRSGWRKVQIDDAEEEAWQEMIADRYLNENLFVTQDAYNKDNNIVRIFKSAKEI